MVFLFKMAKELPYFKFYPGEWSNGDITLESYEIQGLFINICAYYWSKDCIVSYDVLFKKYRFSTEHLDQIIDLGIIKVEGTNIVISFLDEQMQSKEVQAVTNRINGLKGGRPPKKETENKPNGLFFGSEIKANENPNETNIKESKVKESKVKKNREDNIKEKCRLSFEANSCEFGTPFKKVWLELISLPYWYKKPQSAINKSLKQVMAYEEGFAIKLAEKSISGNYMGITWANTEKDYQQYLNQKNGTQQSTPGIRSNNNSTGRKDFGKL